MVQLAAPCRPIPQEPRDTARKAPWSPRRWREIALIAVFYGAYTLVRLLIPHDEAAAYAHAHQVMRLEHALGPTLELKLTHALLGAPLLATASALSGCWVYPLAPPRFLGGAGFVDPVTALHSFGLYSSPQAGSLTNQFAAMPSMHAGWALWCAVALIVSMRRRPLIMTIAALYPIVTITVIFATANHYLLAAVAGVLVMAFALFVGLILHLRENRPRTAKDHEVTNKTTIVESLGRSI